MHYPYLSLSLSFFSRSSSIVTDGVNWCGLYQLVRVLWRNFLLLHRMPKLAVHNNKRLCTRWCGVSVLRAPSKSTTSNSIRTYSLPTSSTQTCRSLLRLLPPIARPTHPHNQGKEERGKKKTRLTNDQIWGLLFSQIQHS